MKAAAILPARNEAACIVQVVGAVRRHFEGEILVVDNGSTDGTAELARSAGARVVCEEVPGYGRACMAGCAATDADVLVFMDADGSDCFEDIPLLLDELERGAALALAVRRGPRVEPGSITAAARFGNWLSGHLIRLFTGRRLHDLSPLKAIRISALREIAPRELTYGWTVEVLVTAAALGHTISEVETGYRRRAGGESKVSGKFTASVRAGLRILAVLARTGSRRVEPGVAGGIIGGIAAFVALAAYSWWLFVQAPAGWKVLVSSWLLAWPVVLASIVIGLLVARGIARLRSGASVSP